MHVCSPDEISVDLYNSGGLYICPNTEKLSLLKTFSYYPHKDIIFMIKPNYNIVKNKKLVNIYVNKFIIGRN